MACPRESVGMITKIDQSTFSLFLFLISSTNFRLEFGVE